MLFAKMVEVWEDNGLILKAKEQEQEDSKKRKIMADIQANHGRQTIGMLNAMWARMIEGDHMAPEVALEELMNINSHQFAKIMHHDEDTEDEESIDYDEFPIIGPAHSKWLLEKYDALAKEAEKEGTELDFPYKRADLEDSVDSNSYPYWLKLLPSAPTAQPDKAIKQLLWQKHPVAITWNKMLDDAQNEGRFKLDKEALWEHRANREKARALKEEMNASFNQRMEESKPLSDREKAKRKKILSRHKEDPEAHQQFLET